MSELTVDASVWVAAADPHDVFHDTSEMFLAGAEVQGIRIVVPAFAMVEVACALARKLRNSVQARRLTRQVMALSVVEEVPIDSELLAGTLRQGTDRFLRGADALYDVTAQLHGTTLVSWDNELVQRAGAVTPSSWLDANP